MCDCHVICEYDTVHGGLSHGNCPVEDCEKVALLKIDRQLPREITVADAQYVWHGDPMQSEPNPNVNEPYFGRAESKIFGHSSVKTPFNRSCTEHLQTPVAEHDWRQIDRRDLRSRRKKIA